METELPPAVTKDPQRAAERVADAAIVVLSRAAVRHERSVCGSESNLELSERRKDVRQVVRCIEDVLLGVDAARRAELQEVVCDELRQTRRRASNLRVEQRLLERSKRFDVQRSLLCLDDSVLTNVSVLQQRAEDLFS